MHIVYSNEQKKEKLNNLLILMATGKIVVNKEEGIAEAIEKMEEVYSSIFEGDPFKYAQFKYYKSDIIALLTNLEKTYGKGTLEILRFSMKIVNVKYKEKVNQELQDKNDVSSKIDISGKIDELCDEIDSAVREKKYINMIQEENKSNYENLEEKFNAIKVEFDGVQAESKGVKDSLKSQDELQKEYVTILGIFAAIVLAFVGGMAFSTSVLKSMGDVSPYRLALVIDGLAFVLTNVIYLLQSFIYDINSKEKENTFLYKHTKNLNLIYLAIAVITFIVYVISIK